MPRSTIRQYCYCPVTSALPPSPLLRPQFGSKPDTATAGAGGEATEKEKEPPAAVPDDITNFYGRLDDDDDEEAAETQTVAFEVQQVRKAEAVLR